MHATVWQISAEKLLAKLNIISIISAIDFLSFLYRSPTPEIDNNWANAYTMANLFDNVNLTHVWCMQYMRYSSQRYVTPLCRLRLRSTKKTKDISCTDSQNCLKKVTKKTSNLLMTQLQKNNPTLSMWDIKNPAATEIIRWFAWTRDATSCSTSATTFGLTAIMTTSLLRTTSRLSMPVWIPSAYNRNILTQHRAWKQTLLVVFTGS